MIQVIYPKVYVGSNNEFYNNLDIDRRILMDETYFYNKDIRLINIYEIIKNIYIKYINYYYGFFYQYLL